MKKCTITLIALFSFLIGFAQKKSDTLATNPTNASAETNIYKVPQIPAQFPGGINGWVNYLTQNIHTDIFTKRGAPTGRYLVNLSLVVNKDGTLSNIVADNVLQIVNKDGIQNKIVLDNDRSYGMKEEAIRLLKEGPNWNPAIQYNQKVASYATAHITFMVK